MILAIHGGHNASASIVYEKDGSVKCRCVEAERIDRIKMSYGCEYYSGQDFSPEIKEEWIKNHRNSLEPLIFSVMKLENLIPNDISQVVITYSTDLDRLPSWIFQKRIHKVHHHLAHIALSYYTSPFEEALGIVIDGGGDLYTDGIEIQTAWRCVNNKIEPVLQTHLNIPYEMGIGNAYELYSYWLGYGYNGCGTTMALASFDSKRDKECELFSCNEKHDYLINREFVDVEKYLKKIQYVKKGFTAYNSEHESIMRSIPLPSNYKIREKKESSVQEIFIKMAGDIQKATEKAVLNYILYAKGKIRSSNLCLSGGTFLNCQINSILREKIDINNLHVPCAPNDSGLSLGAALYIYFLDKKKCPVDYTPYLGEEIGVPTVDKTIVKYKPENIYKYAAKKISEGKLIAWCQGRAELGPRALGNRSLLADPRNADIPEKINRMLKHRERFRPFAPSILEEHFAEYFEGSLPIQYMLETRKIKKEIEDKIPAVKHIDGTARIQIVREKDAIEYYNLINNFYQLTGIPILLNTSLNRNGEPIVNTADEALNLLKLRMVDELVIGKNAFYLREEQS